MLKLTCSIIDTDVNSNLVLENYISKSQTLIVKSVLTNSTDALHELNKNKVDVVFLNIDLFQDNFKYFTQHLNYNPTIIFISENKKLALEAFQNEVTDFLVKPITNSKFKSTVLNIIIKNIEKSKNVENEFVFVKSNGKLIRLFLKDILYFESNKDKILIILENEEYLISSTFKTLEKKIFNGNFYKIHRSFIINLSKIEFIKDNFLTIYEKQIPISRGIKNELLERLNLL